MQLHSWPALLAFRMSRSNMVKLATSKIFVRILMPLSYRIRLPLCTEATDILARCAGHADAIPG